ncbi:CoA transferase [Rhodococcus rhodochrous]|uniref:CaiB/BaiF CoA transferase family protein n=1 Tax=Rhodococcus rhodochrous TaxID=1829 RepID=UPI001E2C146A|nr:CaiB/BaiF CoA-transferase family protein [Rhodococcus rhodochrous]MCB8914160.1 CoA transferase [Rhodococcus rhodochrous]
MAESTGPLQGLRILELSGIGPGPFAATIFGDLGAEVVRVDRPGGSGTGLPASFDILRRSRRSIVLDLRDPRGIGTLLDLVESADVVIEGYRPGVAERLGIGPQDCMARNPKLVYGRMTGWGQDGPLAATAGHDLNYIAITGALHAMGRSGEAPAIPLNLVGDFGGGAMYLVAGVLAALLERERSGHGQVVDAGIVDGTAHMIGLFHGMMAAGQWQDRRGVNILDSGAPWYEVYETSDGQHMSVGAIEPAFYHQLMETLGLDPDPGRRADPGQWPAIRSDLASAFAARTRQEWTEIFEGSDACVAPVLTLREAPNHPHIQSREIFVEVDGVVQPAAAPRLSRTPGAVQSPPAPVGAHTIEVLREWGINGADDLIAGGVAVQV